MLDFPSPFDEPIEYARRSLEEESFQSPELPVRQDEEQLESPPDEQVEQVGEDRPELGQPSVYDGGDYFMPQPSFTQTDDLSVRRPDVVAEPELPVSTTTTEPEQDLTVEPSRDSVSESLDVQLPKVTQEPDRPIPSVNPVDQPDLQTPFVQDEPAPELPLAFPSLPPQEEMPTGFPSFSKEMPRSVFIPPQQDFDEMSVRDYVAEQEEPLETRFEVNNPHPLTSLPDLPSVAMDASGGADIPLPDESGERAEIRRTSEVRNMIERDALYRNMGGV